MFGKKKDDENDELDEQWAMMHEQEAESVESITTPQVSDTHFLSKDEIVLYQVMKDPDLKEFIPLISHLNRTSRLGRDQAELYKLEAESLVLMKEATMDEDKYEINGWVKLRSFLTFVKMLYDDTVGGWRGRLVTERRRITRIERGRAEEQRGRWF